MLSALNADDLWGGREGVGWFLIATGYCTKLTLNIFTCKTDLNYHLSFECISALLALSILKSIYKIR